MRKPSPPTPDMFGSATLSVGGDGDGGVHGVAAALQHRDAGQAGQLVAGADHPPPCPSPPGGWRASRGGGHGTVEGCLRERSWRGHCTRMSGATMAGARAGRGRSRRLRQRGGAGWRGGARCTTWRYHSPGRRGGASGASRRAGRPGRRAGRDGPVEGGDLHMPYWATPWASGLFLAEVVLARPEALRGRRVLELGCGLGTTAVAAVEAQGGAGWASSPPTSSPRRWPTAATTPCATPGAACGRCWRTGARPRGGRP